jgi:nucleotide-binding universal stress UspA family protein
MLERFLVPLDTSEMSEQVLPYVELFAEKLVQPVHVLAVADDGELLAAAPSNVTITDMVDERRAMVSRYLQQVRERLEAGGITVTTEMAVGPSAGTILKTAAKQSSGLIAMATHGRVGLERWFLGSVTDRVVREATTPVLLVRPGAQHISATPVLDRIIVPLDGSELSEAALPYAMFLARAFERPMVLVRTLDLTWLTMGGDAAMTDAGLTPELEETLRDDSTSYLAETAARLRESGFTAETVFSFRLPAEEIADQAHAAPGAMIVMSTHGRSGLGRSVLGSVADRVVRSAETPVLLVRGERSGKD